MEGTVVILNGVPRSGKSSIAAAIQESFPGVWVNLGVDAYLAMTPERYRPGIGLRPGGERPELEPIVAAMYGALWDSVAAHTRNGLNVVVDVGLHDSYSTPLGIGDDAAQRLASVPAYLVGVRCPLGVIMERRDVAGGEKYLGSGRDGEVPDPVRRWEEAVHAAAIYDVEVDTSELTSEECVAVIRRRIEAGPPRALARRARAAPSDPPA